MIKGKKGFTLIELLVVILIIGILTAFAVPQYMKSLENNKADDAAALTQMVATANRMYSLDHNGTYLSGLVNNSCNTQCCNGAAGCTIAASDPCNLIGCKYLAATDFDRKPWVISAGNAAASGTCLGQTGTYSACARRRLSSDSPSTGSTGLTPYINWAYTIDPGGVVTSVGGAPTPTQ